MRSRSSVLEIDAFKIQRKFIKAGDFGELVLQKNFTVSNIFTVKRNSDFSCGRRKEKNEQLEVCRNDEAAESH